MTKPADHLFQSSYRLQRVPQDHRLQAWNAADELFLERYKPDRSPILLLNDAFGALAVALHDQPVQWWHASAMAQEALQLNCQANRVRQPNILTSLATETEAHNVALHIPKSINYFAWQLEQCCRHSAPDRTIYALGMVKHISAGHIEVMNRLFEEVSPGRAEKKARVIELSKPKHIQISTQRQYRVQNPNLTLRHLPGCFAENRPDPGALVFLSYYEHLPAADKVLDLGCGNGILGLAYFKAHPDAQVVLIDENAQALKSAEQNWTLNDLPGNAITVHSNGLNALAADQQFDLILCNPPFHQDNTLTEGIAQKLFDDAKKHLSKDGEFWVVANRHLSYATELKKRFKDVHLVSKHPKFVIWKCTLMS
ncbi:class I SAM-dependent methyltransferase [Reinekea blandensis]|uniref:Uncharacterized protein n=1 Tax=Reinekea blandensis MED297 TaxID=314283 RepID=A4BHH5_9GAMM|nr:class I SAM-dependent methyltransferase [Reinekea blandensis]EAR08373.1 hypothetical protein MED297_16574 [Reinekea blandensis MED297]